MKGVILAAGKGTRMAPFTNYLSKTLLPVYDKPAIYYPIKTIVESGIKKILIITNSKNREQTECILKSFDTGAESIDFLTKDHDLGMPYSILQAKDWANKEPIMVVPGDNIFTESFFEESINFKKGGQAFLRKVKDPTRFGVPIYKKDMLIDIIEKPKRPPIDLAIIAPYLFDYYVYHIIDNLKPSKRGELEIVEVLKSYLKKGELNLIKKHGPWWDIGTFDDLVNASYYMLNSKVES